MYRNKKGYIFVYLAIISSFLATMITYSPSNSINNFARNLLPARVAKRLSFILSENPIDFSSVTIGLMGVLITFGLFAGISLIFIRRNDDT
ncbi:hypothetical protein ACFLZ2_00660 [Candidatus Margulisiibacteriota bacterium]